MEKVLFVCTGNSCRSVMGEGLFKKIAKENGLKASCSSAGISTADGYPSTDATIRALRDAGVDMSAHRSRQLTRSMILEADRIFVMEYIHRDWILEVAPEARGKVRLIGEFSSSDFAKDVETGIPDPIRMSDGFYKNVLVTIRDCVENIVRQMLADERRALK